MPALLTERSRLMSRPRTTIPKTQIDSHDCQDDYSSELPALYGHGRSAR
jgi:hypothetical protein